MAFKKGQSGNPKGRPVGTLSITTEVKKKLLTIARNKNKTYLRLFIEQLFDKALKDGDVQMQKLIWNYIDGMPPQALTLDQTIENNINLSDEDRKLIREIGRVCVKKQNGIK